MELALPDTVDVTLAVLLGVDEPLIVTEALLELDDEKDEETVRLTDDEAVDVTEEEDVNVTLWVGYGLAETVTVIVGLPDVLPDDVEVLDADAEDDVVTD